MNEADARVLIVTRHGEAAEAALARFVAMVIAENGRQNLIAPSTIPTIWERHVVDSAQLLAFDRDGETWLDVGTGGGFPGMIIGILRTATPVVLVEPRTRRAAFLQQAVDALALDHVRVVSAKVERWQGEAGIISARAVATIDALLRSTVHCAGTTTRWVLPKGRSARADVADARTTWAGMFHVKQSIVDPDAGIVIAEGVKRR